MTYLRYALYTLAIGLASAAGWRFAVRTGPLMQPNAEYGACWTYSANDPVTWGVLLGVVALFVGLVLLLARHDRRGTLTLVRRRALVLGLLMLTAFMVTFGGVLEYQNPDKFTNACPH